VPDLKRALVSAQVNDVLAEELAIQRGLRKAKAAGFWSTGRGFLQQVELLQKQALLRSSEYLGEVKKLSGIWVSGRDKRASRLEIWRDRVVTDDGDVFVVDGNLRAMVDTAGGITHTTRPSAAAGLLGSVLPGTALIPAMIFSRTEKHDTRELYLCLEHPEWAVVASLNPKKGQAMRQLATALNQESRRLHMRADAVSNEKPESTLVGEPQDPDEEFSAAKSKLLHD
jgi:hypothetical protein